MLDRRFCALELSRFASNFCVDTVGDEEFFRQTWMAMAADPGTEEWRKGVDSCVRHPLWLGPLHEVIQEHNLSSDYKVLAVDGSQIYPDRHLAVPPFFLINAGGCLLAYGKSGAASLFNKPEMFFVEGFLPAGMQLPFTVDLVDAKREEIELAVAYDYAAKDRGTVVLFDGSIIFWHLESKPVPIRDLFLGRYLGHMLSFFNDGILTAGYISMPKSKELVNLVRTKVCTAAGNKKPCFGAFSPCPCKGSDLLVDTNLLRGILKPFCRTTIFVNGAKICDHYPPPLRPCFFYLHTGKEIARIEIPYWIATDVRSVTKIVQVCIDQAVKGDGYPVVLAEAHEQAVVRGNDRDFFYHLLDSLLVRNNGGLVYSQKSIKKRGLGF